MKKCNNSFDGSPACYSAEEVFISRSKTITADDPCLHEHREEIQKVLNPLIEKQNTMIRTPKPDLLRAAQK